MHGLKTTVALGAILLALVGYIFLVDSRIPTEDIGGPLAFAVDADSIAAIDVTAVDGVTTRLTNTEGGWRLVDPVDAPADEAAVAALRSSLADMAIERVVDETPESLEPYALASPRIIVAFLDEDGVQRELLIGDTNPTGGNLYAKLGDEARVFLIPAYLESTFNKSSFDLRDSRVLAIDAALTDGLDVTSADETRRLARRGGAWHIDAPISVRGDYAAISNLVNSLSTTRMEAIVSESVDDLAAYGLSSPALSVTAATEDDARVLLVGMPTPDEDGIQRYYAKNAGAPAVFTIPGSLFDRLTDGLSTIRQRDVFDFRPFSLQRLEISRDEQTRVWEKADADGDAWLDGAGEPVEGSAVTDLLEALVALRAGVFQDDLHQTLITPDLTVTAQFDDGASEVVRFARAGDDVFATRDDEPGSVRLELTTRYAQVTQALDALP